MSSSLRGNREVAFNHMRTSRAILLVSPESPDIDSVSCMVVFEAFVKWINPQAKIALYCCQSINSLARNSLFEFIKGNTEVVTTLPDWHPDNVVVFDYGNLARAKLPDAYKGISIIGFDHHPMSGQEPSIGIIDEAAASCTVVLYDFFKFAGFDISEDVASTLMAGLFADTGRFNNLSVDRRSFEVAVHLDPDDKLIKRMLAASRRRIPFRRLQAWSRILDAVVLDRKSRVVSLTVGLADKKDWNVNKRDVMTAFSNIQSVQEAVVAAVMIEERAGHWSVSLRPGPMAQVDVNEIAKNFGGGGHKGAAGFKFGGGDAWRTLSDLREFVVDKYKNS
ncbi:MAG: DHHA1 domain-containing protein [bacterium]|nr:DHHA1 domain-containing protein [bacterium]